MNSTESALKPINPGLAYFMACVMGFMGWYLWPSRPININNWWWYLFGFMCCVSSLKFALRGLAGSLHRQRHRKARTQVSTTYGQAEWASVKDCARAGLLKLSLEGIFLGSLQGRPLFYTGKSHVLCVAPARTGKTVSLAIPICLHNIKTSMIIADPKGEIAAVTWKHRVKNGHKVYFLNPWGLHGLPNHSFNPLLILMDDYYDDDRRKNTKDDAEEIALTLLPEGQETQNKFFRDGGRRILVFVFLGLAACGEVEDCTLVEAWRIIQSPIRFQEFLIKISVSPAFDGALGEMAEGLACDMKNKDLWNDCMTNAKNALEPYSPMGSMCESVSHSDFSYKELKEGLVTIYMMVLPEYVEVASSLLSLNSTQAVYGIIRKKTSRPVLLLLDEFTNLKLPICKYLTLLPGLGCRAIIIVQAISEIRRVYGSDSLETILSQCEIKQFFGFRDHQFAKMISDAIGTTTVKTETHNVNDYTQQITKNYAETARPVISPDELRLMDKDEQIIFFSDAKTIKLSKVEYWHVWPWRKWAAANPIEDGKPLPKINRRKKIVLNYK